MSEIIERVAIAVYAKSGEVERGYPWERAESWIKEQSIEIARAAIAAYDEWQPIDTVTEGDRVELFLPNGEKGNGEIAVGMVFRNSDGVFDCYWTWGGPNSGTDINEVPTHWRALRSMPPEPSTVEVNTPPWPIVSPNVNGSSGLHHEVTIIRVGSRYDGEPK